MLLAACLLWASSCFASDMRFVDANGYTGYYVDASSVSYESVATCDATIAVIKADRNRMFCYTMHFDRGRGVYQILSSQVLRYDTKEVLSAGGASLRGRRRDGGASLRHLFPDEGDRRFHLR